jgi:hypothetical protein
MRAGLRHAINRGRGTCVIEAFAGIAPRVHARKAQR